MARFLGFKFKINMKDLVDTLMKCACYFIRCIKSNEAKKALKHFTNPNEDLKQIFKYLKFFKQFICVPAMCNCRNITSH